MHQKLDREPKRNVRFRVYIVVVEVVIVVVVNKSFVALRYLSGMHILVVHLLGQRSTHTHRLDILT